MRVLVVGNRKSIEEFNAKFSDQEGGHEYTFVEDYSLDPSVIAGQDAVFDFLIDENQENVALYGEFEGLTVFANVVKTSLAELAYFNEGLACNLIGFNGLPSFFAREVMEISVLDERDREVAQQACELLGTEFETVGDRVGMVGGRIAAMAINEAYYALQEQAGSKSSINRLSQSEHTSGPFDWSEAIGLHHVYELLEALYEDTKDPRYRICPLLKREYLLL